MNTDVMFSSKTDNWATPPATLPGGCLAYGIEDEPNHIDWIINPEKIKE